jgi:hypothetical protein
MKVYYLVNYLEEEEEEEEKRNASQKRELVP